MDNETFWSLIGKTRDSDSDQEMQLEALDEALEGLETKDIEDFERCFRQAIEKANTWDLWGAAAVILGEADDESFANFQCWLISRGREVFELVLADPDELADLAPDPEDGSCEFEEFAYVAMDVWVRKTGKDPVTQSNGVFRHDASPPELSGKPVRETPAHLARRYPRLWERFGEMAEE